MSRSIAAVALCICTILALAWYVADSVALRFVILFCGTMAASYALADVYIDGFLHGREDGSDCRVFAEKFHSKPKGENSTEGENDRVRVCSSSKTFRIVTDRDLFRF
jgi:hypothetical protein